jgi:hypothetical protein
MFVVATIEQFKLSTGNDDKRSNQSQPIIT